MIPVISNMQDILHTVLRFSFFLEKIKEKYKLYRKYLKLFFLRYMPFIIAGPYQAVGMI
jgi:hypothetical protein